MGKNIVQKILERHAPGEEILPGKILWFTPDLMVSHQLNFVQYVEELNSMGIQHLSAPDKVVVVMDHEIPAHSLQRSENDRKARYWAERLGIKNFFDVGRHGISHQLIIEKGFAIPGQLIISSDTHATMLGAVGAFSPAVGYDLTIPFALGTIWLRVPQVIKILAEGKLLPGIMSRDLALKVIAHLGLEQGDYRVMEFDGETIRNMDMDGRMTLCNVVAEIGAKAGIVNPDETTLEYLKERTHRTYEPIRSDPDAEYETVLHFLASELSPQVVIPPAPHLAREVKEVQGLPIDQVYIGSCASGRMEDLRLAARIMAGKKVSSRVRAIIVPSSQEVYLQALEEGLLGIFTRAGAIVLPSHCGACYGGNALLASGEVCVSTTTRNEPGRMGSEEAQIFLASAATAAASAIAGKIEDPRNYLS